MRLSPRSARVAIWTVSLCLVVLPLAMLAGVALYEQLIVDRYHSRLTDLARRVAGDPGADVNAIGHREGVEIVRLDHRGAFVSRSATDEAAFTRSPLGGWLEARLDGLGVGVGASRATFAQVEAELGPPSQREEVASALGGEAAFASHVTPRGDAVLFAAAAPSPDGAVLVMKGSLRGLRRLLLFKGELLKLMVAQAAFAALTIFLLGRWLVRPLEHLAAAVRTFPARSPAAVAPALERRPDEIGELARAISQLAGSLETRRRAAADLAADLAHELKNPLATIAAASELFSTGATDERRALVQSSISDAVQRMRTTTDELLRLMRLEVALGDQPREEVEYLPFLDGVLGAYRRDPRWSGFTFTLEGDPALRVRIAPTAWEALLRNLLDNALVQPAQRREIVVSARPDGAAVVTSVKDFGPGVSEGNREKIFRRFFTQRPEGAPPGTGLGLSIVQAVAEAHGGRVDVASPPGEGATFRVWLPG
ncbi:MAG TPA: HAMP domain-containing sensor histidine kinase [Myxococcales bacterium]|nr:HAMP domain-containing sensor histidine kinase [Myxococcales bacterium]